MQTRYGGKDVGVLAIDTMEDVQSHELIEPPESCHVAWRTEHRRKAVVHGIPWRCCGVDIVTDEPYEVHREECPGEAVRPLLLMGEIEVYRKSDRHRHPTEIEATRHEVEHCTVVDSEPLTGDQSSCSSIDAEKRLLRVVQAPHIDAVELVVGKEIETAVDEAKEEPRQHAERESACRLDGNEDGKQNSYQ